jgi:hypothetical protein
MKQVKQLLVLFIFLVINSETFAAVLPANVSNNVTPNETVTKQSSLAKQMYLAQMRAFVSMSVEKYGELRDKKLNTLERLAFKMNQKRAKSLLKAYSKHDEPNVLSKISWVAKGFLLGPIALILGYLFLKDDDRELIKWIWFGFAGFVVVVAIFLLTVK